uniref:glutathione transferase n=1 Tax=Pseudonaja textilis TaxID=8673 RepID=A0A670ZVT1_PSETE
MGLELYLDLLSQPCRAVYLFAKKNRIAFELKNVELFKDSILGTKVPGAEAEGGATHPSGSQQRKETTRVKKVPILKDDTFILSEGTAILLYLSRKYNTPDHWYPSDLQKRAKVDEYLSWHQATIRSNAPKTMWIKVLIPLLTGQPLPPEKLQEVMDGLAMALDYLEGLFLQDKPFLVGSEVSLADLVAIVDLMQPVGVGCDIFKDRPRLVEWRKRTEDAIGKELFLQAHELILNIRQHFTEEFNKVNILRKVPVLKDGDFILEESTAILLYLTRKYNTPSYWYPPDMKKRARVDEYLAWQISTIRAGTSKILWLKVRPPPPLLTGGAAPPTLPSPAQTPMSQEKGGLAQGGATCGGCFP